MIKWWFASEGRGIATFLLTAFILIATVWITAAAIFGGDDPTQPDQCGVGTVFVPAPTSPIGAPSYCTPAPGITVPPNSAPLGPLQPN